jgi:hypothetical protein
MMLPAECKRINKVRRGLTGRWCRAILNYNRRYDGPVGNRPGGREMIWQSAGWWFL